MSELINTSDNRTTIRWKLLTGASFLAMTAYISSANLARAEDSDRPTLWIEFGGQMELMQGLGEPFIAPFMTAITPTPAPYRGGVFTKGQEAPRFAFGLDGKISFQPEDSDWIFSAGIRYGRSHAKRHIHHQTPVPTATTTAYRGYPIYDYVQITRRFYHTSAVADIKTPFGERHTIVDFQVGKEVGLGLLGRDGSSNVNAGVRFAQFQTSSTVDANGIPRVGVDKLFSAKYGANLEPNFYQYTMHAHATRSFKGVGPSLSWNGSAAVAGNNQDGELMLDFGVNAALLFGRQKAKTDHSTQGYHAFYLNTGYYNTAHRQRVDLAPQSAHSTRSRRVTVPNVGGFAGISLKWPNAKLSVGYRADMFLNAMDIGIDATKKSNLTFNGPYASISIGLGD